jgi:DNA modification methylase
MKKTTTETKPKATAAGVPVYCAHDAIIRAADLKPNPKNPNKHPDEQIERLGAVIRGNGWRNPITVSTRSGLVVKGHGRLLAAIHEGLDEVPVDFQTYESEAAELADLTADNKIAELSETDERLLAEIFADIDTSGIDFERTGYSSDEYDEIAAAFSEAVDNELTADPDDVPLAPVKPVTKRGDVWILGRHRLICGDATNAADADALMEGNLADLVFTDPPYNVDYTDGHDRERKILNDNFATDEEAAAKLWTPAFENMRKHAAPHCSLYCCMPQGSTHMMMMLAMIRAGWQVKHELIWRKQSIVLNRADYNYQHEPIAFGWNEKHKFYGGGQFHTTSVWEYDRPTKSKEHPTMKPVALITEAILNSTKKGDKVIDFFAGSGSTLIACETAGRTCYASELDEHYADVIVQRYVKIAGGGAMFSLKETARSSRRQSMRKFTTLRRRPTNGKISASYR